MLEMMPPWMWKDEPPKFLEIHQGQDKLKLDLRREVCNLNDGDFIPLTRGEFGLLRFMMEKPNESHHLEDVRDDLHVFSMSALNGRLSKLRKKIAPIEIKTNNRSGIYLKDDGRDPNIVAEMHGISVDKTDRVFYGDQEVTFQESNHKLRGMLQGLLAGGTVPVADNARNMHFIRKALADASITEDAPHGLSFIEMRGNQYAMRRSPMVRRVSDAPEGPDLSTDEIDLS